MIYTSYFSNVKKLPPNVTPVCITVRKPSWFRGQWYGDLAPEYWILNDWKNDHDNEKYTERFMKHVLEQRNIIKVMNDFQLMLPIKQRAQMTESVVMSRDYHIALICYEAPEDFCHRHIVAQWLHSFGIKCEEWMEDCHVEEE